jgi:hypothetical protein
MSEQQLVESIQTNSIPASSVLLGTGLALASFIIVPALATRFGLGSSFTGALRIALMKASAKASLGKNDGSDACATSFSCH